MAQGTPPRPVLRLRFALELGDPVFHLGRTFRVLKVNKPRPDGTIVHVLG